MLHINKTPHLKTFAKFLGVACLSLLSSYHVAQAGTFAASACDPDYYESLESRAWLEAQREITQNQNLIFKPDSVLEYTCFDNHLKELAQHAEDMFSETDRWGGSIIANRATHMDGALVSLVMAAFDEYDDANFNHGLLGGRIRAASDWAGTAPGEASGFEYDAEDPPGGSNPNIGGDYTCDIMQAVWQKAKCLNFVDSPGNDGFFKFDQYTGLDKRFLPTRCGANPDWTTNIQEATVGPGQVAPFTATGPWDSDVTNTYFDRLFPASGCGTALTNRVRTGLTVFSNKASIEYYREHICLVPGCFWEPSGGPGTLASPSGAGSCVEG